MPRKVYNIRCTGKTKAGERCMSPAIIGDPEKKCWTHSPKKTKERFLARQKGGQLSRSITQHPAETKKARLRIALECTEYVEEINHMVLTGQISTSVGKVLLQGVTVVLAIADLAAIEKLRDLEVLLMGKQLGD